MPSTAHIPADDATSLSHFLRVREEQNADVAMGTDARSDAAATLSWEDYKEQRLQAKQQRKREREERGEKGVLAMLGWNGGGGGGSKEKNE